MDNKCPKCGKKLSIFYLKQNCPECGCNIMYYDMEKRLVEDSVKAEAEWEKLNRILAGIVPKSIREKRAKKKEANE